MGIKRLKLSGIIFQKTQNTTGFPTLKYNFGELQTVAILYITVVTCVLFPKDVS